MKRRRTIPLDLPGPEALSTQSNEVRTATDETAAIRWLERDGEPDGPDVNERAFRVVFPLPCPGFSEGPGPHMDRWMSSTSQTRPCPGRDGRAESHQLPVPVAILSIASWYFLLVPYCSFLPLIFGGSTVVGGVNAGAAAIFGLSAPLQPPRSPTSGTNAAITIVRCATLIGMGFPCRMVALRRSGHGRLWPWSHRERPNRQATPTVSCSTPGKTSFVGILALRTRICTTHYSRGCHFLTRPNIK